MRAVIIAAALAAMSSVVVHAADMQGMEQKSESKAGKSNTAHKAVGVVKKVDPKAGTVTLDHEPVKSMNWPAMTMTFQVKDKALMDKLTANKKVEVEFEQQGKDYIITSAK